MLKVENINKYYGDQQVLEDISFSLKKGEIVGFLGPNGAGKSTMMKVIMGYLLPDSGTVRVGGDIDVLKNSLDSKKILGYLPESNPLYMEMYIKEFLTYISEVRNLENTTEKIKKVINLVGLEKEQHKKIKQLSKGYKQRVGLAQAIIHNPKVLILDEPTTGLDPNQLVEIRNVIKEIGKEKTILFSTHIMQEVEAICDRVIIINKGIISVDKKIVELSKKNNSKSILVEFDLNIEKEYISKNLKKILEIENIRDSYWRLIFEGESKDIIKNIYDFSSDNNINILQLNIENNNLENIFNSYTK